jgi:putative membrane protein
LPPGSATKRILPPLPALAKLSRTLPRPKEGLVIDLWLAIAHHLIVFTLVAILAVEIALIRPGITADQVVRLRSIDGFYGSLAGLILFVGILRVMYGARGQEFYSENPVFWMKMGAFALVGLISIQPTIKIYGWWQQAKGGASFSAPEEEIMRVRKFLKAEAAVFTTIPAFAAAAARGIGL